MSLLLGSVVVVLLLAVVLLAIPLTLQFTLSWPQTAENDIRLHWLFGLVNVRLPFNGVVTGKSPDKKGKQQASEKPHSQKTMRIRGNVNLQRDLFLKLLRLARRCWQSIEKKNIRVWLRLGLDDPADTGVLWGIVSPLAAILSVPGSFAVKIVPDFTDTVVEFQSSGSIRFVPLQLVSLILGALVSLFVGRAIR